jgi:hypothetical protein
MTPTLAGSLFSFGTDYRAQEPKGRFLRLDG